MKTIWRVEGGFHASEPDLRITVFGATEDEAKGRLVEAIAKICAIDDRKAELKRDRRPLV